MGRPPIGKRALTGAERQRRYLARLIAGAAVKPDPTAVEVAALRQELAQAKARIAELEKVGAGAEKDIGLGGINILPEHLRALRPEVVKQLMKSIRERGKLKYPITVRPRDGGGYWLITGLHRFIAVKKLKHKTIRCIIRCNALDDIEADEAELL